ncbi:MAG TPA: PEP-CTERM sorting domain-containing protein [Gammaproteobacteria bacterium]|nr:PEP-CTERM sorting domain-containing protein [Gammaproteobacteria bacterium]
MKILNKTLLAAGIFAMAGVANAIPITGSISFTGAFTTDTGLLATAATISNTSARVTGVITGSFAAEGISSASSVTYSNFTFNPISVPVNNLWSVGSFSFNLTQMAFSYPQSVYGIGLHGSGIISSSTTGLDPTPGSWRFNATSAGDSFVWGSSSAAPKSVPEPAAVLLLGAGLIGFGVTRQVRKARKAA